MEAGFIVLAVIAAVVGVVVGMFIERKRKSRQGSRGILFVDCRNPEYDPSLFLQATVSVSEIVSQKQVLFDVRVVK